MNYIHFLKRTSFSLPFLVIQGIGFSLLDIVWFSFFFSPGGFSTWKMVALQARGFLGAGLQSPAGLLWVARFGVEGQARWIGARWGRDFFLWSRRKAHKTRFLLASTRRRTRPPKNATINETTTTTGNKKEKTTGVSAEASVIVRMAAQLSHARGPRVRRNRLAMAAERMSAIQVPRVFPWLRLPTPPRNDSTPAALWIPPLFSPFS